MGLSLPMGGHLTHGWSASVSGKWFRSVAYSVDKETCRVDLTKVRDLAKKHRSRLLFCGGSAIPRIIEFKGFAEIAHEVDALLVADVSHIAGLVVGGVHPTPIGHADIVMTTTHKTLRGPRGAMLLASTETLGMAIDRAVFPGLQGGPHNNVTAGIAVALHEASMPSFRDYARRIVENAQALAQELLRRGFDIVSGGTDNHLILIDLKSKEQEGLPLGKPVARALDGVGIVCNYNTVPHETRSPQNPSGLRLGTPAATTR